MSYCHSTTRKISLRPNHIQSFSNPSQQFSGIMPAVITNLARISPHLFSVDYIPMASSWWMCSLPIAQTYNRLIMQIRRHVFAIVAFNHVPTHHSVDPIHSIIVFNCNCGRSFELQCMSHRIRHIQSATIPPTLHRMIGVLIYPFTWKPQLNRVHQ